MIFPCAWALRWITSMPLIDRRIGRAALEQRRPPHDGVERRAKLVRDRSQEFILDTVGLLGALERSLSLFIQSRLHDRRRGAPCQLFGELQVVGSVTAPRLAVTHGE